MKQSTTTSLPAAPASVTRTLSYSQVVFQPAAGLSKCKKKTTNKRLEKRSPKGAAVIIRRRLEDLSYTELIRVAKSQIELGDFRVKVA
jgi:hypothetical protein